MNQEDPSFVIYRQAKKTFWEIALFLFFLTTVNIVSYGYVGTSNLYLCTDMLNKVFTQKLFRTDKEVVVDFQSVTTVDEFWKFTETVLLDGLNTNDDNDKSFKIPEGTSRIMNENILLGNIRLRQLRVRNDSCSSPDIFLHIFQECYDFYSSSSEDQRSFGLQTGSAWNFHTAALLDGFPTWTSFQTYSGGGYFQDLTDSREKNRQILQNLHESGWMNRGTRVLFIEFTIYNPNINVLCVSKLIVEVLPTGGLITSSDFRASALLGFTTTSDLFLVIFEILLAIQLLIFTVHEIIQMKKMGWNYFNFWNFIDLIIIFFSYFALSLSIFFNVEKGSKIDAFNENPKKFVNFDSVSFWQLIFFDSLGILTFFVWIRILKFVNFSKTMVQFGKTLKKCVKDVAGFGLMFIIVFVAYAQLGFILFGSEIYDFRTFFNAVFTLLRTILGDFDYLAIEKANRILGPVYFLSYIFIVFFVLLNMFLAIINETYTDVKSTGNSEVLPLGKFIKAAFMKRFKIKPRDEKQKNQDEINAAISKETEKIFQKSSFKETPKENRSENENLNYIKHADELESLNERVYALENAVDYCAIALNNFIKKLK